MKRPLRSGKRTAIACALAACLLLCPLPAAAEDLTIGGTGSALGTMKLLAGAYRKTRPDLSVRVLPSIGSGGAVKAVSKGALDIGVVSRPLTGDERDLGLASIPYGSTPLVFATNTECPVKEVSTADLVKIYDGTMRYWPCGNRVRIVLRPARDSDTTILKGLSPEISRAVDAALSRRGMLIAVNDQEAADILSQTPERFGTTTLALIASEKRPLSTFSLNGVKPSLESIADGSYPLKKGYSFVTAQPPGKDILDFVGFVRSPEGRRILEETGILPLKE